MDKRLNLEQLSAAMEEAGTSPADLARALAVSRETISKWLNGKALPRPDKLLRLGKAVGLSFAELVIKEEPHAPVVAFRRARGTVTKDHHIERAQSMGRMLRHLVQYLPLDVLAMPPVLKDPRCDYDYLQQVASMIRREINVDPLETIDFRHLIRHFRKLQAVLIPVLWGNKKRHKNATHIYLPDSRTTWVYLNLDVNVHDFKFWMAHELGHCLIPQLRGDEAEDFADAFAGALLFPHELASGAHKKLVRLSGDQAQLKKILALAKEQTISPLTVYEQVNAYAKSQGQVLLALEPDVHAWTTRFNGNYLNVTATLFDGDVPPEPLTYMEVSAEAFETPFFDMLSRYLKEHQKGHGLVQTLMDIPLLDARSLHAALT